MTVESLHTLPLWVWLLFTILLIGVIVFIYSQGNWRTTVSFLALTTGIALAIFGIDSWIRYLHDHFIGQYDALGIPFKKAGPGWSILLDAWPLWLVPIGLTAGLLVLIDWSVRRFFPAKINVPTTEASEKISATTTPLRNISQKLELETLKKELNATQDRLAETIELAETQLDKKQYLEARLEQTKEDYTRKIEELEDRIAGLTAEIQSHETQEEELTALTLKQSEEIHALQSKLNKNS